jgi:hypothetical protein
VPKSRSRKTKLPRGVVPMTPRVHAALLEQRKAFIEKFGREPGPGDPVFFDPDKDVPTPMDAERLDTRLPAEFVDESFPLFEQRLVNPRRYRNHAVRQLLLPAPAFGHGSSPWI